MSLATSLSLALALSSPHGGDKTAAQKPMASLFPASSYAFAEFAGLKRCRAASEQLSLIKLVERVASQFDANLIPPELERGLADIDRKLAHFGLDRALLRTALQGPVGFGLGRLTIAGREPAPSLALAIDVRSARDQVKKLLKVAGQQFVKQGFGIDRVKIEGETVYVIGLPDTKLLATLTDDYLFVSNSSGYLRDCLRCMSGQRASLAKNAMLRAGNERFDGKALASLFVNAKALIGGLGGLVPYEVEEIGEILGITGLDGIYFGIGTTPNGPRDILHIGITGAKGGLLRSVIGKPASHRAASLCPDDTLFYGTGHFDLGRVESAAGRLLAALPEEAADEIREGFEDELLRELKRNGVSPRQLHEIFSAFGNEVTIAVPMIGTRTLIPQAVAFIEVKKKGIEKGFAQLLTETCGVTLKENQFKGHTLHYTSLQVEGVRISPAFTVQDGMLIIASDLRALKAVLREPSGKSLRDQESFQKAIRASAGASLFSTVRLGDNIGKLWRIAEPFAERAQQYDIPITPDMLPTEEELQKAISNTVSTLTVNAQGLQIVEDQPLGGGLLIAAAGRYIDYLLGAKIEAPKSGKPQRKIY